MILCACCGTARAQDAAEPSAADTAAPAQGEVATIPVAEAAPAAETTPASSEAGAPELGEVVVTAQKTKQNARSVPISMSVLSDRFIAQHGIVDIVQAMQYVPNVKIASAGFFAAPQARGFSFNNNNKAFESPLGIAFDGIPYTNTTYFNAGLFDIERVEVLRGPQGTTFGKNTTAGLVSIVTADPTPDWVGLVSVQGGEIGRQHYEAALSGPLIEDVVDFRIAAIKDELGGYVRNTTAAVVPTADPVFRGYAHNGYRAKLKFPDLWGTQLKLSFEAVDMSSLGAGIEVWDATEPVKTVMKRYDPNADFVLGNLVNSEDQPENRLARTKTAVIEWTVPAGDWELTALGGWSQLKETVGIDVDFSPVPGSTGDGGDRFPTTTLELRAKSPTLDGLFGLHSLLGFDLGHTDFLGGFFMQRRTIRDSDLRLGLNDGPLLELTAAAELPDTGTSTDQLNTYAYLLGSLGLNAAEASQGHEVFDQVYDQEGEVLALFQQTEWAFLPDWKLQLGLRASRETKKGYWNDYFEGADDVVGTALGL
ncbi:MAG TPA: TonB-dependent receptor, partial [Nevskiaceae bacterium]|nr:TonB-dependent receptor [Nevskiaceae bacterium]